MALAVADAGARTPAPTAAAVSPRPLVGVAAVLVGAFISTLNTRVTTFGLADIRGGLSLGFDEGSWLNTAFSASQMIVAPSAAWLSMVFGVRRFMVWASAVFTVSSLLVPLITDYDLMIALQLVRGLSVGTFIPAALGFILRSLPPRWWIWGIAAYAFRFTFSQNVAASLEAFYSETGHWEWIFWQNVVLTPHGPDHHLWRAARGHQSRSAAPHRLGGHHLRRLASGSSMPASIRATVWIG
jgi:Arabinose efflux permease